MSGQSQAAYAVAQYWDEDHECANCGGEGVVYGCSWDWQCDTYDEGEGTCLCERRCDWCNPRAHGHEVREISDGE